MMTEISYSGYRFPPAIIQPAIWLWWLFAYFVVITIGKLHLSPIGASRDFAIRFVADLCALD